MSVYLFVNGGLFTSARAIDDISHHTSRKHQSNARKKEGKEAKFFLPQPFHTHRLTGKKIL